MPNLKSLFILAPAFLLLSACGGTDGCAPAGGRPLADVDTSNTCAETQAANSVTISYPINDAISQLPGQGTAIYSLKGSASVTDPNGNAVADGTVVQLDVVDSIIASGTINAAGDSITGSTLTDTNPEEGDGSTNVVTTFTTSAITRGGDSGIQINTGDMVILQFAHSSDHVRYVSSVTATTITVSEPYNNTYPSALYPAATFLIADSLIATSVVGVDEDGVRTPGVTYTKDGVGNFALEYPGDSDHLGYGRFNTDARYAPLGSTQVWVTADVGGSVVVADQTGLGGFAPLAMTTFYDNVADETIITVVDANGVPYSGLTGFWTGTDDATIATSANCIDVTQFGSCRAPVTFNGALGDVTLSYSAGGATADQKITVF